MSLTSYPLREIWDCPVGPDNVGSYKPVVIFFGMTNSPVTFQSMMNEILRDMINEGKVAVFVDNVLIRTKTEKRHDELVEKVLK